MSVLFDDWAYHEVFEPPSPKAPEPEQVSAGVETLTVSIPEPEVRPRAASMPTESAPETRASPATAAAQDAPLTQKEARAAYRVESWLGAADPQVYDFDSNIWQSQMAPFLETRTSAGLASRLARSAQTDAQALSREIDWILHELRDTKTHDLATLNAVFAEHSALAARKDECRIVREVLRDIWEAQDHAARVLRGPAPKAIPHLSDILGQAERARAFCHEHPDFQDIMAMEQAWKRSAQRALAIALAYASHELRKITLRASANVKESTGGAGAVQALIYAKFEADARHLVPTIALLRHHSASAREPELQLPWGDLQTIYFQLRTTLVGAQINLLAEPLDVFTSITPEFLAACRTSLVQFRQLYAAEEQLYLTLFGRGTVEFWDWLGDSSDRLYATLRRIILHETDISRLCELIVLVDEPVASEIEHDGSISAPSNAGSPPVSPLGSRRGSGNGPSPSPLAAVRQDAENRLVFRANISVDELSRYTPQPKDFLRTKFPPIESALELLGQVYQILSPEVFNELAHRCVRECIQVLDGAVADRVVADERDTTVHLYHVRQLLVLQSQIVEFDLHQTVVQEVDFSGIQKLLRSYQQRVPFRELVAAVWDSVPKVVETMFDAMEEIFSSLRRAVDRLCATFVAQLDFSKLTTSVDKNAEFREGLAARLAELGTSIDANVADIEVRAFLLDSVQEAVLDRYTVEYRSLSKDVLASEAVMDIDTMAAWLAASAST